MAQRPGENRPLLGRDDYDREGGCSKYLPEYIARRSHLREFISFMLGVCLVAACVVTATLTKHADQVGGHDGGSPLAAKRNLVFMVSDGMGPASVTLARNYRKHVENLPIDDVLVLDRHFWGTSRTRSSSALVTDSAAGATAFSCARKSYNGAISVTPDEKPCGSVLEAAKRAGYHTGLVATTYVTDATPACFASHVLHREYMSAIAMQEIGENVLGRSVDLILGGGRCYFLPNSTRGACREDGTDVTRLAQDKHGWSYSDSREAFDALRHGDAVALPHLGLYADHDIPYEIDRRLQNATYPSLSEMAATALRALEKATEHSDKGFFIMIEGSRIDHAGHHNDPAAQVHEVLEYDRTFQVVLDFIARSKTQTVLVSTSDHETGGLATAITEPGHNPVYDWYPQVLARANASCELLAGRLQAEIARRTGAAGGDSSALSLSSSSRSGLKAWIDENLVKAGLGIPNARDEELDALVDNPKASLSLLAGMISVRAHLGWSTGGHTAVDVNIYTSGGPGTDKIRGNVENTDVGGFLSSWLDVDVDEITDELIEKGQSTGRA
ncbi:Repressible alkaline phosphatase [Escovopsis weberi]|uniref:Alkaline phosphatase n=1 Tax=Escovopsis weberi TaxID=150374 RepID=A0A0M8N5B2_ESCWE|nr:Repressible alkaline phosphatase [Escovopsis weberi]